MRLASPFHHAASAAFGLPNGRTTGPVAAAETTAGHTLP